MARPTKRKGSRHAQFRIRIPDDVLAILGAHPEVPRPTGWGRTHVALSTARHARPGETEGGAFTRMRADFDRFVRNLRQGARPLTDEQIAALAGEAYRLATDAAGEQNGRRRMSFEPNAYAAELVVSKGMLTDSGSLERLAAALTGDAGALIKAAEIAQARHQGDFLTPHPAFPEWSPPPPSPQLNASTRRTSQAGKLSALVERYFAEKPRLSAATRERYRPPLLAFVDFLGDPPAASVTEEDVRRFRHERVTPQRSEVTVHKADLVAVKSLFAWATDKEAHATPPLSLNPAADVKVKRGRQLGKVKEDRSTFYDDEIATILRAARAVPDDARNPHLAFAKRWCPWIAAYTGARIAVIANLRRDDVRQQDGVWFMRFPPAKGFPTFRDVPVHKHLIEIGFLDFVRGMPEGPLFIDPTRKMKAGAHASQAAIQGGKVAAWVRKDVGIARKSVDPNHGWKHTFKSRMAEAGVVGQISDALTGNSDVGQGTGRIYEHVTFKMLVAAMRKFPRFKV